MLSRFKKVERGWLDACTYRINDLCEPTPRVAVLVNRFVAKAVAHRAFFVLDWVQRGGDKIAKGSGTYESNVYSVGDFLMT